MSIKSRPIKRGDKNESSWPSEFGTGVGKFKRKQKKLEPQIYIIDDSMPLTKSPLKRDVYFQSKSALRKHYKQNNVEEIGTDYDNGSVDRMQAEYARDQERDSDKRLRQNLIDRAFHGKQ